jgi:hypothetical protein
MSLFTKEEWELLDDILGHVSIDTDEMDIFFSMKEKLKQLKVKIK